jgi:hypothetical protein
MIRNRRQPGHFGSLGSARVRKQAALRIGEAVQLDLPDALGQLLRQGPVTVLKFLGLGRILLSNQRQQGIRPTPVIGVVRPNDLDLIQAHGIGWHRELAFHL